MNKWGYKEETYRLWTKILEIDEDFFQISKDDDAYDFVTYTCATNVDGDIFVEHDVDDIEVRVRVPKCINGVADVAGIYDEVVEWLDDSEDDKVNAIVDGFDGVDVSVPINQWELVSRLIGKHDKKTKDDEYVSDELDSSNPYESGGISVARAWRAKLIAKKIIERGADKQYANLWRYVVELRRVNLGNTMKINVERPLPSNNQDDVQSNASQVNDDVQPDAIQVNDDVQPDASQVNNDVHPDNRVDISQASSCVVDISRIGLSQVQAKEKKGSKPIMKMRKRQSERIKLRCF
ncbi:hypothetical protein KIW84_013655 [Lathyrus oleraceus]|uniref:Uncharacterized protein n=1 Tax=Pisum sativum TaxID=3888 RepID=A0A9D5GYG1_PEA|nr:hypothetical protein KIW84_013655 [Pisum sativum]